MAPARTKVKKLGGTDERGQPLSHQETARREQIIKQSLAETKNTEGQLTGADIRGGTKAELTEKGRIKEQQQGKFLNPQQPVTTPAQSGVPTQQPRQSGGLVDEFGNPMPGAVQFGQAEIAQQEALVSGADIAGKALIGGAIGGAGAGLLGSGALSGLALPNVGAIGQGTGLLSIGAIIGKLAQNSRQSVKETKTRFTGTAGAVSVDNDILNLANSGDPSATPDRIFEMHEENLGRLREIEADLANKTDGLVGRQLSGAMDELIAVQNYISQDSRRREKIIQALNSPNRQIAVYSPPPE